MVDTHGHGQCAVLYLFNVSCIIYVGDETVWLSGPLKSIHKRQVFIFPGTYLITFPKLFIQTSKRLFIV